MSALTDEFIRDNPHLDYVLDRPRHRYHGIEGTACIDGGRGKVIGLLVIDENYSHFVPCEADEIAVKGNLQTYGANGEGAADDIELFYVGRDIDNAILFGSIFCNLEDAKEENYMWGGHTKIFKVKAAVFFDTAEEV